MRIYVAVGLSTLGRQIFCARFLSDIDRTFANGIVVCRQRLLNCLEILRAPASSRLLITQTALTI